MRNLISEILESDELGTVGRRRLLQGLVALTAASNTADAYASTFQGVGLNHLAIRVTNVERSRDFYQKLLGLPVIHEGQDNCFLGLGKNFLTLFQVFLSKLTPSSKPTTDWSFHWRRSPS